MAKKTFTVLTFEILRGASQGRGFVPKKIFSFASWNAVYTGLKFLEKEKLIIRKKDGRNRRISLTEKGKLVLLNWSAIVRTVGVDKLGKT